MTLQPVLAKALAAAMPGFQRWMQWPVQTADAARGNAEAAETEAYVASRAILAALAADPATTEAVAAALHDRYGAVLCIGADEQWVEDEFGMKPDWVRCGAKDQWYDEARWFIARHFGAAEDVT